MVKVNISGKMVIFMKECLNKDQDKEKARWKIINWSMKVNLKMILNMGKVNNIILKLENVFKGLSLKEIEKKAF